MDNPRLPAAARAFLAELADRSLIEPDAVPGFLNKLGDRLPHLASRDRVGDALVAHGLLSRYQRDRALAGHYHGLIFGSYHVLERLGGGSIGPVFLAEHAFLKRRAAVKVLPAEDTVPASVRERFAAEARILAGIDHPNVIPVYDAGVVPGEPGLGPLYYAVLELATGGDVENFVYAHGVQSVPAACEWGRQAAAGLRAVHDAGLVHRDIKPSNLVLTDARRVKLVDFGLAREFGSTRTPHRVVLGSLDFLAPEQLADAATAGPAADLYGLGVTLFWVLTGQLPHPSLRTSAAAIEAHRAGTPKRLRELLPDAPAELDDLFARLMARNPADRPTAGEAVAAFAAFAAPSLLPGVKEAEGTEAERLRGTIAQLEGAVLAKTADAESAQIALMATLAAVAAVRPDEPVGHQRRVGGYVRLLASKLAAHAEWRMFADPGYVNTAVAAGMAHDFGHVVTTDPPADHPVKGAELLAAVADDHGPALPCLRLLRDVIRQHHERWDGTGSPDGLVADAVSPAARVVALAVAYDDRRRAGADHATAAAEVHRGSGTAFDPAVVKAFGECETGFEELFDFTPDDPNQPPPAPPKPAESPTG